MCQILLSGDRIVATLGEGVAARDPRRAHPASPEPAIALNCFIRVMGAGRVVATGWRQDPGKGHLVAADHGEEELCHEFNLESLSAATDASAARSANDTSSAAGRAIRTTSYRIPTSPAGESAPRKRIREASRSRRRARFRSTEPLIARLTVTPTLPSSAW